MKKIIAVLLFVCLVLAGCGREGSQSSAYLNICTGNSIMSLDNSSVSDSGSIEAIGMLQGRLFRVDGKGNILPDLVESYEVSPDGLTYIFHLKEAYWSNGDPITAEDFEYSITRLATNSGPYSTMLNDPMCILNSEEVILGDEDGNKLPPEDLGVYADDERTLRIELFSPVTFLTNVLTYSIFSPIKRDFYESLEPGTYGTSPETYLSSGAFVLEKYIPGATNIVFKKNENYHDKDSVALPGVNYHIIDSETSAMEAFRVGDLDIVSVSGKNSVYAREEKDLAPYIVSQPGKYLSYISFNLGTENATPIMQNKNFRLALIKAIDRQKVADSALGDGSIVSNRLCAPNFAYSQSTGEDFAGDQSVYADLLSHDSNEALKYLDLAKKELNQDNFTISLYFRGNSDFTNYCQIMQQQITKTLPEVSVELYPLSSAENSKIRTTGGFDVYISSWGPDYMDPMTYFALWNDSSSFNYGKYKNPEYSKLIEKCTTGEYAGDYEKRWETLKEAESIIIKDAAVFPVLIPYDTYLVSPKIQGFLKGPDNKINYSEMKKQ